MRIISRKVLKDFWIKYPDAEEPLKTWFQIAKDSDWNQPKDVKKLYRTASILRDGRVVFNIGGNKYRLIVWINFEFKVVYIRFIGTHKEYDKVDAQKV